LGRFNSTIGGLTWASILHNFTAMLARASVGDVILGRTTRGVETRAGIASAWLADHAQHRRVSGREKGPVFNLARDRGRWVSRRESTQRHHLGATCVGCAVGQLYSASFNAPLQGAFAPRDRVAPTFVHAFAPIVHRPLPRDGD